MQVALIRFHKGARQKMTMTASPAPAAGPYSLSFAICYQLPAGMCKRRMVFGLHVTAEWKGIRGFDFYPQAAIVKCDNLNPRKRTRHVRTVLVCLCRQVAHLEMQTCSYGCHALLLVKVLLFHSHHDLLESAEWQI